MSKFTFKSEYYSYDEIRDEPESVLTMEFCEVDLVKVLDHFEDFLRGSGFVFDGHLTIEEKDYEETNNANDGKSGTSNGKHAPRLC